MFKKIIESIKKWHAFRTSEGALNYYRSKGIIIGEGTKIHQPNTVTIDITRPELITIGKNVLLHKGLVLMTHDFASRVFIHEFCDFIPSHGHITIGDNVWFGQNCTVLKGVTIGDNCIIGFGSTVLHDVPSNSVVAGSPARVICTLGQYYEKRQKQYVEEAVDYALSIMKSGREPKMEDFWDDYPCFVDGTNYQDYPYPYMRVFKTKERFEIWKKNHKKIFKDFNEFIEYAKSKK